MLRRLQISLFAALWITTGNGALAEDDYARTGFYVGAGAMGAEYVDLEGQQFIDDVDTGAGFTLFGGYRVLSWLSTEAEFELFPDTDFDSKGGTDLDLLTLVATANLKVSPLTGRIQPYLFAGPGYIYSRIDSTLGDSDEHGFAARFGGGVDLHVTSHVVLFARSSYVLPPLDDQDDLDYVSFGGGLLYRF